MIPTYIRALVCLSLILLVLRMLAFTKASRPQSQAANSPNRNPPQLILRRSPASAARLRTIPPVRGTTSPSRVVADGGRLANVLVYVKDGLASRTFDPPRQALIVKQQGCSYAPHVAAVMSVNLWTSLTMTKRCTTSIPSRRTIRNGTARRCPTPPQSVRRFRTLRS